MMVSSSIPFAPISWWVKALRSGNVLIDVAEHYQKMSYRNRYYLAGTEGKVLMSIPLVNGRNQRKAMAEVLIDYTENWQQRHWKTMVSLYNRSPFFEHYSHHLQPLYEQEYATLHEWNQASLMLISKLLQLDISVQETHEFHKEYANDVLDVRHTLMPQTETDIVLKPYYQVFAQRQKFVPDCSILDLLFCEGKSARSILLG